MKEVKDSQRPPIPLNIGVQEVALIENLGQAAAEKRVTQLRKAAGLSRKEKLTIWKYCELMRVTIEQVIPYHFRVLILSIMITLGYAFTKRVLQYSCEFFRKHKMIWEEKTPVYLKGHTFVYDEQTKKMEKVTIEITKIK